MAYTRYFILYIYRWAEKPFFGPTRRIRIASPTYYSNILLYILYVYICVCEYVKTTPVNCQVYAGTLFLYIIYIYLHICLNRFYFYLKATSRSGRRAVYVRLYISVGLSLSLSTACEQSYNAIALSRELANAEKFNISFNNRRRRRQCHRLRRRRCSSRLAAGR